MSDLKDRVALVTGSSRGIGAAIATTFAKAGARIALHGRDEAALASVQARITDLGGQAISVTGDVTIAADLAQMREEILDGYGHVDVLVTNAGSSDSRPIPIEDITEESWRADIDRNLTGTFLTVKCFLPGMKERAGAASSPCPRQRGVSRVNGRSSPTARRRPVCRSSRRISPPRSARTASAPTASPRRRSSPRRANNGYRPTCSARSPSRTRCVGSVRPKTSPGPRCSSRRTSRDGSPASSSTSPVARCWSEPRSQARKFNWKKPPGGEGRVGEGGVRGGAGGGMGWRVLSGSAAGL